MPRELYEQLANWLVPVLLAAMVHYVRSIGADLKALDKTLTITKENHERRITHLEEKEATRGPRRH